MGRVELTSGKLIRGILFDGAVRHCTRLLNAFDEPFQLTRYRAEVR